MRLSLFVACLFGAAGCVHSERPETRALASASAWQAPSNSEAAAPEDEAPRAPQRLSHVVTLGQDQTPYLPPEAAQGGGVTVNNDIVIQNGYGYGYGYGYAYGYGARGGRSAHGEVGAGSRTQAWAPTGWEGAQRTAAPGQTPNVGGNWARPPSYGPPSQR